MQSVKTEYPTNRPAPANDYVTISVTMTREEWRAIAERCGDGICSGLVTQKSCINSACHKITKAIRLST